LLESFFENAGWEVESHPESGQWSPDLVVRRPGLLYIVEVKSAAEGRADRLVPLFAQAVLQSQRAAAHQPKSAASRHMKPMAVVAAPKISRRAAEEVLHFAENYAPEIAAGVIDFSGLRMFRGPHLDGLSSAPAFRPRDQRPRSRSGQLFSDLNQWMLKVLLAPELPEHLLAAPRGEYQNSSELARAAGVSVMSAFRFVQQLQDEGYLHESSSHLKLVRRQDLFNRWKSVGRRGANEMAMRLLLKGNPLSPLRKVPSEQKWCLALFAAADALKLGHVQGVPRYIYLPQVPPPEPAVWKNLRPCSPEEPPDLIFRQAPAPASIFRGAVQADGIPVSGRPADLD
jgi:hypothetical protein